MSAVGTDRLFRIRQGIASIALALLVAPSLHAQWQFEAARVVAVADIHGAYDAFERILARAEVIDDSTDWAGGDTHLVIVGDVLDRGADSRRALDLIRKLEAQAPAGGGRVHLLLGNHEIMNLVGDLRYVSDGEYAAFADEELLDVRSDELERFAAMQDAGSDATEIRTSFDTVFPPGYFAHRAAFSRHGEYGAWLLGKPVLVVINGVAFVHAGLVRAVADGASGLNESIASELDGMLEAHDTLIGAGFLSRTVSFYDWPLYAGEIIERLDREAGEADGAARAEDIASIRAAAGRLTGLANLESFATDGPVWYRGNVGCNRLTEQPRLRSALASIGADRLVIGHTPTQGALVLSRMDETLLRIDTGMLNEYYGGRASALLIENGAISVLYEDVLAPASPLAQPRRVGLRPADLTVDDLEALLQRAQFELPTPFDNNAAYVQVADGDRVLTAIFTRAEDDDANGAVAAYRLDRLLGLDMVPVTVAREVGGVVGALQFWPEASIDETERSAGELGAGAWCPLADQFGDMYLFDALIFNEARTADRIRYSTDNFQLMLVANDQTFSTARNRPAYLENVPVELTAAWREALGALNEDELTELLDDVLSRRRIRALLARRDLLLELDR